MKTRKLKNGSEVEELDSPIKLVIETKCPNKWKIIDMETGQAYIGTDSNKKYNHWQPDDIKIHMDNNKEVFLKEMKKLHKKLDDNKKIQSELAELNKKLSKHIDFIDDTYEGLKNPINAARRWLGR